MLDFVVQEGMDPSKGLHRLASQTSDGGQQGGSDQMPHKAMQHSLDVWVPLLVDECDFAAACLMLYKPTPVEEATDAAGTIILAHLQLLRIRQ